MIHQANIVIHVIAGSVALLLGALAIIFNTNVRTHKKLGLYFLYFMTIVVTTGFIGALLFRSDPFLMILVIISGYDAFAGFRIIRLKENHPEIIDAIVPAVSLITAWIYLWKVSYTSVGMSSPVITSTMAGLTLMTVYDLAKYFYTHRFVKKWWLYEHIYKMLCAFSAIFSAFSATVITAFRPYTQLGPAVICFGLIIYFIWKRALSTKF
jgi:hypothetical protein